MTSWSFLELSTMLGSTVALGDDSLGNGAYVSAMRGSTVALGDDIPRLWSYLAHCLRSTLDTWCCQSKWPFH